MAALAYEKLSSLPPVHPSELASDARFRCESAADEKAQLRRKAEELI